MMIASLVPVNDSVWLCYTDLLEICRLVFKTTISTVEIEMLESLIFYFLSAFKECFNRKITPKMHFLVHYPRQIRLLGPLGPLWCMRYEAKHSYFKQLSRSIGNFINPPWTLAWRHQQWQCSNFFISERLSRPFLHFSIEIPTKNILKALDTFKHCGQLAELLLITDLRTFVKKLKWLKIASSLYKVNKSIVLCPISGSGKMGSLLTSFITVKSLFCYVKCTVL